MEDRPTRAPEGTESNPDRLEVSLANDLRELAGVASRVDRFCEDRGLAPQIAYAVNLSVDEILTNTISYGYGDDEPHVIEFVMRMEDGALVVVIEDDGAAFDVTAQTQPELDAPLGERRPGGLGLFLVRQMMDGVEYQRRDGRNVVTLTKRVAGERNSCED